MWFLTKFSITRIFFVVVVVRANVYSFLWVIRRKKLEIQTHAT